MKQILLIFTFGLLLSCSKEENTDNTETSRLANKNAESQMQHISDTTEYTINSIGIIDSLKNFFCESHILTITENDSAARKIESLTSTYPPHAFFNANQYADMPETITVDSFYSFLYAKHNDQTHTLKHNLKLTVPINTKTIFEIAYHSSSYTGGAHGSFGTTWQIFNRETGDVMKVRDIIKHDSLVVFDRTLSEFIRTNISTISKFTDEYIKPDQLGLSKQGIVVRYNTYTLGSYADGPQELTLPIEKCSSLVSEEYQFWH